MPPPALRYHIQDPQRSMLPTEVSSGSFSLRDAAAAGEMPPADPQKKTALSQIITYPAEVVKTELKTLPDTIELRIQY